MRDQPVFVFCEISVVNLKQKLDELLSFGSLININVNIKVNNEMVVIVTMIKVKANSLLMMGTILCSTGINTSNKIIKEWKSTSYWEEVYLCTFNNLYSTWYFNIIIDWRFTKSLDFVRNTIAFSKSTDCWFYQPLPSGNEFLFPAYVLFSTV